MLVESPSDVLKENIADVRSQLVAHPLYAKINHLADIRQFMSTHVLLFGISCRS